MNIIKIKITGGSGFGPTREAYVDKIVITNSSIKYKRMPYDSEIAPSYIYRKMSYKTTNPYFQTFYQQIAEKTQQIIDKKEYNENVADLSRKQIIATYEDNHKEQIHYYFPTKNIHELFVLIKKIAPGLEINQVGLLGESNCYETEDGDMVRVD